MAQTYYEFLGVQETATSAEIEAAFRRRASELHPDRIAHQSAYLASVASEAFKSLSEARAVLLDPAKRQKYDAELARSRGRPTTPYATDTAAKAPDAASSGSPDVTARRLKRVPYAGLGFGVLAASTLLLAVLLANKMISRSPAEVPATATPAVTPPPAQPPTVQGRPAAAERTRVAPSKVKTSEARAGASSTGDSHTLTLWRASQPPDLSALSSSDRLTIESACSYALTQSQETYNGCLVQQLAVHGTAPPPPEQSTLSVTQRKAIEAACSSAKLMQGSAAYNQCVAQHLELFKRGAP